MNGAAPKGWCPSTLRPMEVEDGLLLRIRTALNEVTPEEVRGIAELAERYGSGILELTSRANLQIRGVSYANYGPVIDGLDALGLLKIDRTASARVNIVVNPFRTDGDRHAQIAVSLADGLGQPEFAILPFKFGFAVDCGPQRYLDGISGDIRIEASGDTLIVRADGCDQGAPASGPDEAVDMALEKARWFAATGGIGADGRGRLKRHIDRVGPPTGQLSPALAPNPPTSVPDLGPALIPLPDPQFPHGKLREVGAAATGPIRLTPFRAFFLPERLTPPSDAARNLASAGAP